MSYLSLKTKMRGLLCLILAIPLLIVSSACNPVSNGAPATAVSCEVAFAAHSGDAKTDREIARIQQEIKSNAKPFQTMAMIEKLGWSFVEKARESFAGANGAGEDLCRKSIEVCVLVAAGREDLAQATTSLSLSGVNRTCQALAVLVGS